MQEWKFLVLLVSVACRTMATRHELELDHVLTTLKCCQAAGDLSSLATVHLPPSQTQFREHVCTQGAGMSKKCKKQTYKLTEFTVTFSSVQTLRESDCTSQNASRCHDESTWETFVEKSRREAAEKLRCPTSSILRKSNAITCEKRRTVAIFADYDDCWDIISPTNPITKKGVFNTKGFRRSHKDVVQSLVQKLEEITKFARVVLFVGSDRQSSSEDINSSKDKQNGLALGADNAFELWVQKFAGLPGHGHCWELNKALLSDDDQPCSSWNQDRSLPMQGLSQKERKRMILENGIKQLLLEEHVDLYLFDAHADFLTHVRSDARIPPNMQLHTFHYNWVDYASGKTTQALKEIA